jgi:hypothetical protein
MTETKQYSIEAFFFRWALRVLIGAVILAAVSYVLDFTIWRLRVAAHGGMGTVTVNRVVAAELKDSKEDYYYDGTQDVPCSRSIFPQGGFNACWWQQRHHEVIDRY